MNATQKIEETVCIQAIYLHSIFITIWIILSYTRDLEGRRMRIAQIYAYVLLYSLWKAAVLMCHPSYQNGGKILSIEKPPVGRR